MSWVCPICSSNNEDERVICSVCDYESPHAKRCSEIDAIIATLSGKASKKVEEENTKNKSTTKRADFVASEGLVIEDGVAIKYQGTSKEVVFPDVPLKEIKGRFLENSDVETVIIPNSVEKICAQAFLNCSKLKYVWFLGEVGKIEPSAFEEKALYSRKGLLMFNQKDEDRGWGSFWRDYYYDAIWDVEDTFTDSNGNFFVLHHDDTATLCQYNDTASVCKLSATQKGKYKLTRIYKAAFYQNSKLVEVVLPDTIQEIGEEAFNGCTSLRKVSLPNNTKLNIDCRAFMFCTALREIVIPGTVRRVGHGAFIFANKELKIYVKTTTKKIPKTWSEEWNVRGLGLFNVYKRYKHSWLE